MAEYETDLKRELPVKIEQRKLYNHNGRIYPTLSLFLSRLKRIFTLCLLQVHEL